MPAELPELIVADATAWRVWLSEHWEAAGVWLVLAKKGTTTASPTTKRWRRRCATAGSTARCTAATRRRTCNASRRGGRAVPGRTATSVTRND